ncbi:MAG TPA: hypothetical protein DCM87_06255 [Planctomycetes bacterium]|nr:hypothetical protein [Planctomycetota bacterium]
MMNRRRSLLVLSLWLLWCGCASNGPARPPAPGEKPLRLIFISCAADAAFFEPVKQGMRDAAAMLGVACEFTGTPGVDTAAQAALVRVAVADGYDGIALNIIHPVAFDAAVEEAIAAGVPVVAFNVDDHATPNARLSAVNQRLYEAGRALGAHVAPHIPDGAHVLFTLHDEGVSALDDRLRGLKDALREKRIVPAVLVTGNVAQEGAARIAEALRKDPEIRVILGTGQADTEAAGLAIERDFAGAGCWAAGFDLSPETLRLIRAGRIRCTIDQQPYAQGFYPVVGLVHYLRYGIMPPSIDAGAAVIDAASAARVLDLTARKYR